MSSPPDDMRLRALLEQVLANGNAAIIERDRLRVANEKYLIALEQVSMHAAVKFVDDNAVMESWIRVIDIVNATIKATKGETT
jgi:hypothetical protein